MDIFVEMRQFKSQIWKVNSQDKTRRSHNSKILHIV
jgi:hypothetical protein